MTYNLSRDQYEVVVDLAAGISYLSFVAATAATLPVELIRFEARIEESAIRLEWETASEINNSHFEVQRSLDSENWVVLDRIQGYGNSNEVRSYSYADAKSVLSGLVYYRLRQLDFDGTEDYSRILVIELEASRSQFSDLIIYPNPARDAITISGLSGSCKVTILDLAGQVIKMIDVKDGVFQASISDLRVGTYVIYVEDMNGKKYSSILRKI